MTCFSWYYVMLPSIIAPEMHIKTISSIFSDISMHQKCQTGWIHDLACYFLSKDQIFTCSRFSWPFDLCSPYLNTSLHINYFSNRVLKYEHFEGYLVVLGLIMPEIQWFLFPIPLNFSSKRASMSVAYDVIFQLLPGYQKSTQTFWMCHIVYINNVKRILGHLSCTRA